MKKETIAAFAIASTMVFSAEVDIDYSAILRKDVKEEYTWNVSDIYKSEEDWKKEKTEVEKLIAQIDEKKKGWTTSPEKMYLFLKFMENISIKMSKLYSYTSLMYDTDMENPKYQAMQGEIYSIYVNLDSVTSFINPDIIKLGDKKIGEYIKKEPKLKDYDKMFDVILLVKEHILSEDKEEIISLTGMFSDGVEKAAEFLNNLEIPAVEITLKSGEKVSLNYTNYVNKRDSKEREDRVKIMREYWENHAKFKNTHAALMDANVKQHYFNAKVRNYNSCLKAALYPKKIDTKVYTNLIKTVKNNLSPLHRYIKLKERMLKLDKIKYDDIYASAVPGVEKKYSMKEAEELVINSIMPLGKEYIDVLSEGFKSRWMDMYPNKGKRSGAYSNGSVYGVHPYILMNFNGNYNAVSTLAHEFGHAMHSYFSNKYNPYSKANYPIFLAEIASTFNETMLINYIIKNETDDMFKLYLLDQRLENLRATIYRQTLFAEFELAMHEKVEKGETLTSDWLSEEYLKLTREYYGADKGIMEVDSYIENEWSVIPHFYYNFYVYQYTTGIVSAIALVEKVEKKEPMASDKYLTFLKSGGSEYPLDTLKKAGVDLTTEEPIVLALKYFDDTVSEMEKIYNILEKNGKM
jgi:oligoendopeptidase F